GVHEQVATRLVDLVPVHLRQMGVPCRRDRTRGFGDSYEQSSPSQLGSIWVKHHSAFCRIRVPMTRTLGVRLTEKRIQAAERSVCHASAGMRKPYPRRVLDRGHRAQAGPRKASCHEAKRHRWGVTGLGVVEMSGDVVELELAI